MKTESIWKQAGVLAWATLMTLHVAAFAMADDAAEAKAKKEEGKAFFEQENYPAALAAYEASYKLVPETKMLFNIAMCQKALFMYAESIATFQKLLKNGDDIKPELKAEANSQIDEMLKRVSRLSLNKAPTGAAVYLNGKRTATCPLEEPLLINPGDHVVEVKLEGFKPFRKEVEAASGREIVLSAEIERLRTLLKVECADPNAVIKVDGKPAGVCPMEQEVTPGDHEVLVESSGMTPVTRKVNVPVNGVAAIAVELVPIKGSDETTDDGSTGEEEKEDKPGRGAIIAGFSLMALGVGAGVVGGIFTAKYIDNRDVAQAAQDRYNQSPSPDDYTIYERTWDQQIYKERMDKLPGNKAVMAVGFAGAGVCLAAGTVLVVLGMKKKKAKEAAVNLNPTGLGLSATF